MIVLVLLAWVLGGLALAVVVGGAVHLADARRDRIAPTGDAAPAPLAR